MTMSVWGIFLRSTITVARIYVDAAEAAEGRPRRHKEEEEESHRGHPRPYKLGAGVHLIFPLDTLFFFLIRWIHLYHELDRYTYVIE